MIMSILKRVTDKAFIPFILRLICRVLQFLFAITVAGLYGPLLYSEHKHHLAASPQWAFVEIVAGASAITTIVYMLPGVRPHMLFAWDALLFILWVAVFGTFGKIYMHRPNGKEHAYGNTSTERMRHAVWIDLINTLLWFITAVYGAFMFFSARKQRTSQTGRANV